MISDWRASASATIAGPAERARSKRLRTSTPYESPIADRLVQLAVRLPLELRVLRPERTVERHLEHAQSNDP